MQKPFWPWIVAIAVIFALAAASVLIWPGNAEPEGQGWAQPECAYFDPAQPERECWLPRGWEAERRYFASRPRTAPPKCWQRAGDPVRSLPKDCFEED